MLKLDTETLKQYEQNPEGLYVLRNFLTDEEILDISIWWDHTETQNSLCSTGYQNSTRQIIQYGYKYNYSLKIAREKAPEFPPAIQYLADKMKDVKFNQCIINRYISREGIAAHTDSSIFGDMIMCYTFGCSREMCFEKHDEKIKYVLNPGDLYIMSGNSRWHWKHSMTPLRKKDGPMCYSITLRTINE